MEIDERPILFGVVMAPIQGIDNIGETFLKWLLDHVKFIIIAVGALGTLRLLIWIAPAEMFYAIWNVVVFCHTQFANILSSLSMYMVCIN